MNDTHATQTQTRHPVSLASLLALHDEAFVRAAYLDILGREVDPDGLANYLVQLRTGEPKAQIAAALARSDEGQRRATQIAALAEIMAYPMQRPAHSIWARLFKRLTAAAMEPLFTQLRIIDNTAARIEARLQQQSERMAEVVRLLEQGGPRPVPAQAAARPAGEPADAGRMVHASRLPPSVRRIFLELKSVIAVKRSS